MSRFPMFGFLVFTLGVRVVAQGTACSNFKCPLGFNVKLAEDPEIPTEELCCQATCENVPCPAGHIRKELKGNSGVSQDACCQATCANFECNNDDGFVSNPDRISSTILSVENCCSRKKIADCNHYPCPVGTIKLFPSYNDLLKLEVNNTTCCANTCVNHKCPYHYKLDATKHNSTAVDDTNCCVENPVVDATDLFKASYYSPDDPEKQHRRIVCCCKKGWENCRLRELAEVEQTCARLLGPTWEPQASTSRRCVVASTEFDQFPGLRERLPTPTRQLTIHVSKITSLHNGNRRWMPEDLFVSERVVRPYVTISLNGGKAKSITPIDEPDEDGTATFLGNQGVLEWDISDRSFDHLVLTIKVKHAGSALSRWLLNDVVVASYNMVVDTTQARTTSHTAANEGSSPSPYLYFHSILQMPSASEIRKVGNDEL